MFFYQNRPAYEQNNNNVKIDSVAVGIFHNERTLLEWVLTGPYASAMIFESSNNKSILTLQRYEFI